MSSPIVKRLLPAAKLIFASIKQSRVQGILLGGAAQAMLGGTRITKDLDINVTTFPTFNHHLLNKKEPNKNGIMQVTYKDPQGENDISCDVTAKRASMIPLFLQHSKFDDENGIHYANHALLLADKIRTFSARPEHNAKKRENDLIDIEFCINHLFSAGTTMPNDLKALYSADDWAQVKQELESFRINGKSFVYFAEQIGFD